MSSDTDCVAELLVDIYPEREKNQWRSVSNLLKELSDGKVIPTYSLASVALGIEDQTSEAYEKLIKRAKKLPKRTGDPGRLEVEELSRAALQLVVKKEYGHRDLIAHVCRVGFGRMFSGDIQKLYEEFKVRLGISIKALGKRELKPELLEDPVSAAMLTQHLQKIYTLIGNELKARDERDSITFACITGQVNIWSSIDSILCNLTRLLPFQYELNSVMACFASFLKGSELQPNNSLLLPPKYRVDDPVQLPMISMISNAQSQAPTRSIEFTEGINNKDVALQALLEILFIQQVMNNE